MLAGGTLFSLNHANRRGSGPRAARGPTLVCCPSLANGEELAGSAQSPEADKQNPNRLHNVPCSLAVFGVRSAAASARGRCSPAEFGSSFYVSRPLAEDIIALPEVTVESDAADIPDAVKPVFNTVWNAYIKSDKYDQQGKWIGAA